MARACQEGRMKKIQEDAPTNATGAAVPGTGDDAQAFPKGDPLRKYKKKNEKGQESQEAGISLLRRKTPMMEEKTGMFAGNQTFVVPSNVFHKAKLEKRKGKHWKTYIGEDEHGQAIREYDRKHKGKKPIILQDESTGAMCYAKYGKERDLQEAPLLPDIGKKAKFNPETGRKFSKSDIENTRMLGKKIGSLDKDHDLYHKSQWSWLHANHYDSYHVVHRDSGKVTTTVHGKRNPKTKTFSISTTDSTGTGPKAHKVYRKILQTGHSNALVGSSHSEGGQKIWQKLSSEKGVSVHGWHAGKPVNIDPKDPEETHVSSDEARKGYLKGKKDLAGRKIYKMKLVASLHKRKTV